jgi:hypothetical protein
LRAKGRSELELPVDGGRLSLRSDSCYIGCRSCVVASVKLLLPTRIKREAQDIPPFACVCKVGLLIASLSIAFAKGGVQFVRMCFRQLRMAAVRRLSSLSVRHLSAPRSNARGGLHRKDGEPDWWRSTPQGSCKCLNKIC